jgi:hypothetical protein
LLVTEIPDVRIVRENIQYLVRCSSAATIGCRSGLGAPVIRNICDGRNKGVSAGQVACIARGVGIRPGDLFDPSLSESFDLFLPGERWGVAVMKRLEAKYLQENRYQYPLLGVYEIWPFCGFEPKLLDQLFSALNRGYPVSPHWMSCLREYAAARRLQWYKALQDRLPGVRILVSRSGFGSLLRREGGFRYCDRRAHRVMLRHIAQTIQHPDVLVEVYDDAEFRGPDTVLFKHSVMTLGRDLGFRWRDGMRGQSRRRRLESLPTIRSDGAVLAEVEKALAGDLDRMSI